MDNSKLIALIESASEGSEYLDYAVQRDFGLMKPVPAYTRSIDAAMSLVPEGWSIYRLNRRTDCRGHFTDWSVELYRAADVVLEPASALAATAPLAVAAAALRARQHVESAAQEGGENLMRPADAGLASAQL